jgi:hypothetical protein
MKIQNIRSAAAVALALTVAGHVSMAQAAEGPRADQPTALTSDCPKTAEASKASCDHKADAKERRIANLHLGNRLGEVYGDPEDAARLQYRAGR